jgi:mannose-6-phosphate isomerase-like protein (cupin superfamily)
MMSEVLPREPLVLTRGQGRTYECGPMLAVFKADGQETGDRYTVSEWRIAPNSPGPGAHSHAENDEVFLVTEGRPSVLAGERWHDLDTGAVIVIPATVVHDFANRTDHPAALFNVFMPGGFEKNMPAIVEWYRQQS